jgi:hypothetical protein
VLSRNLPFAVEITRLHHRYRALLLGGRTRAPERMKGYPSPELMGRP